MSTINTYDPNALYRLSKKVTILPSTQHAQDLSYTYDPVGNITRIIDNSSTAAAKTIYYSYDDLSRLLTASTTNATTTPDYKYTYAYDALGNITSGPLGTYSYTGNTGSSYANPDAPTAVGSTTLAYDQNGNMTSEGSTSYTWDYRNRPILSGNGSATSSYAYDDQNNRVKLVEGTATAFFPNTLYTAASGGFATTSKNIFGNGLLLSTIEVTASSATGAPSGITLDATSSLGSNTGSTITWNHTATSTGSNVILLATIYQDSSTIRTINSVTYGGVPMSTSTDATVTRYDDATFYLVNPPSGTHAITATFSASPTNSCGDAISFTGIDQSHPIDATSSKTSSGETSESQAIRTNTDKAYIADSITVHVATALTASSSQQKQRDDNISANSRCAISTLGPVSPAGTSTLAWTWNGSSQPVTHVITSLKPAGGVPGPATTTVTTRYISTDYLTGSNVVTNASGTVAETLDYYPYGGLRIDAKSNYGGVRDKYAGTVYDPLSGLNYMQARYQNPNRGQFLSQDPVFWSQEQNLKDPQSFDAYNYAEGNPISGSDPLGLLTILIPGTWYNPNEWASGGIHQPFIDSVSATFRESTQVVNESSIWSGDNTDQARLDAAKTITNEITNHQFSPNEKLNIIGLSHGGNVAVEISNLTYHKIDNFVTMGTPVRGDYVPNRSMIGNFVDVYSNHDQVQNHGGSKQTTMEMFPGALGQSGFGFNMLQQQASYEWGGEIGAAGRTFSGAQSIDATSLTSTNPIGAHGELWGNSSIWKEVESKINGN